MLSLGKAKRRHKVELWVGNYAWENPSQAIQRSVARQQLCSQLGCFDPDCTMKISVGVLLMGMVVMTPPRSHLHAQHPQLCVPTVLCWGLSLPSHSLLRAMQECWFKVKLKDHILG